ncbi:unnamed protein product, partial [Meganyctiphanes norvegica]
DPDAPLIQNVDGNDNAPRNLSVFWNMPVLQPCTWTLTGFTLAYQRAGDDTINIKQIGAFVSSYELSGLKSCSRYRVSVAATGDCRIGHADTKIGKTGSKAPGKPFVTVEGSSTTSIALSWIQTESDSCPITGYTVNWFAYDIADDGNAEVGTNTSYTIVGLICNTQYRSSVTAHTEDSKYSNSEEITKITYDQAPGQTTIDNISPDEENPTQLKVLWSDPSYSCTGRLGAYNLIWKAEGYNHPTDMTDVYDTYFTITGLIPCTTYTVSVSARSNSGIIGVAGSKSTTTHVDFPGRCTNLTQISFTPYSLEVMWNSPLKNPCSITNYTVCWADSSGVIQQEYNVTMTHHNITGLAACTNYAITVIAYTERGPGIPSDPITFITGVDALPVDLRLIHTSRSAIVTWNQSETECTMKYEVEHSGLTLWINNQTTDPGYIQEIDAPYNDTITVNLQDLLPYSKYNVCVIVDNGGTLSNTFISDEEVPSAPRDIEVEDDTISDDSLTVTWQFPEEENGLLGEYVIYWSLSSTDFSSDNVSGLSYNFTGHRNGNYSFIVAATNRMGISTPSETIYCLIDNSSDISGGCGGACIAGIVVGILLVALIALVFIYRKRIKNNIALLANIRTIMTKEKELGDEWIAEFRKHVQAMELDDCTAAFQRLHDKSQHKFTFAATKPFNKPKNRYETILPFDDTRVKLELKENGPKGSDYINANYIIFPDTSALKFIATQGPLENTINDFWRMIWENNVYDIVILCNLQENGESKCAQYWTDSGVKAKKYGEFNINYHSEEENTQFQFVTRYINITKNSYSRSVKQHHYTTWPDQGLPHKEDDILRFLAAVKANIKSHDNYIVVHDSAGVGRTGTFIGLWVFTNIMEARKLDESIDVHKIVLMMRECRPEMVQTKDQYLFLHKCLLKYLEHRNKHKAEDVSVERRTGRINLEYLNTYD